MSQLQEALHYYRQQLEISREISFLEGQEKALGNIGTVYKDLGNFDASLTYLQQKLSLTRQLYSRQSEAYALSNMGNTYTCLEQYEEAIRCQQTSLEIAQELGDTWGCAAAMCNLGDAYRLSGQFDAAVSHLLNSLLLFDSLQAPQVRVVFRLLIQIAHEVGIEAYGALLEKNLVAMQDTKGEEAIAKLRPYLYEPTFRRLAGN